MSRIWQTIRGYIWWTHPRGGLHYDVMVSLILLFIFLAPHWVNFNDKPTERTPHRSGVLVLPDGNDFVYQIEAAAVTGEDGAALRDGLLHVIEPIAGEVDVDRYEPVRDSTGRVLAYKVWVRRPYRCSGTSESS
jgi:hypothetical protein